MDTQLINIGQIVRPLRVEEGASAPSLQVSTSSELLIREGRIVSSQGSGTSKPDLVIDAKGGVVLPGLLDAHRFVSLPIEDVEAAAEALAHPDDLQSRLLRTNQRVLERALRTGITTVELKSSHGPVVQDSLAVVQQLRRHGAPRIIPTLHASLPTDGTDRNASLASLIGRVIPMIRQKRQADFCEVRCCPESYSVDEARMVLRAARGAGMKLKLELGAGASKDAEELAYELDVSALVRPSPTTSDWWQEHALDSVIPILLPGLHDGRPIDIQALRTLLDSGWLVGLGTGSGLPGAGTASMWATLGAAIAELEMTLEEALIACTLGNAAALELDDTLGTLTVGARADLCVLDVPDYRELLYGLGENPVRVVLFDGRVVHEQ